MQNIIYAGESKRLSLFANVQFRDVQFNLLFDARFLKFVSVKKNYLIESQSATKCCLHFCVFYTLELIIHAQMDCI